MKRIALALSRRILLELTLFSVGIFLAIFSFAANPAGRWSIVPSPNTVSQENYLADVTCASASDCWAVGRYWNGSVYQTLIERWDGTSWAIVASPNSSVTRGNWLYGVTCVSSSDCWAVGYYITDSAIQTLIERWDGTSWAIVISPNVSGAHKQLPHRDNVHVGVGLLGGRSLHRQHHRNPHRALGWNFMGNYAFTESERSTKQFPL